MARVLNLKKLIQNIICAITKTMFIKIFIFPTIAIWPIISSWFVLLKLMKLLIGNLEIKTLGKVKAKWIINIFLVIVSVPLEIFQYPNEAINKTIDFKKAPIIKNEFMLVFQPGIIDAIKSDWYKRIEYGKTINAKHRKIIKAVFDFI